MALHRPFLAACTCKLESSSAHCGPPPLAVARPTPADLGGSRMCGVNLAEADLKLARLDGADMSRANLAGAMMKLEALEHVTCVGLRGRLAS